MNRPADPRAAAITFGVELETHCPRAAGVEPGSYHGSKRPARANFPDDRGRREPRDLPRYVDPAGREHLARADTDGSIRETAGDHNVAVEWVTPVLHGAAGLDYLARLVTAVRDMGCTVDESCGVHVHVGVGSVLTGDPTVQASEVDPGDVASFGEKLTSLVARFGMAYYAQTGTNRYAKSFCQPVRDADHEIARQWVAQRDVRNSHGDVRTWDRYRILNFNPLYQRGTVEFRAFAGTTNLNKVLHHVACCLGTCRYAAVIEQARWVGKSDRRMWQGGLGENTLRYLWGCLGWQSAMPATTHAFGLHGMLYDRWESHSRKALELARKFDQKYPETY